MSSLSASQVLPSTQRQWQIHGRGNPKDLLNLVDDAPVPTSLQPGEVLVKVAYATTTPSSWKVMRSAPAFLRKGAVPELEASGWVVYPNESDFAVDAQVTGMIDDVEHLRTGRGVLSEYAVFRAPLVFDVPPNLTLESITGLLSSGMTAYKALVEEGHLRAGQRIFINGGTTACGMAAIQIAKILDASEIIVSCSEPSFTLVESLGATQAIDYRNVPLPAHLTARFGAPMTRFDLVLDCVGTHELYTASPAFLSPAGAFVTIAIDVPADASWLSTFAIFGQLVADMFWPAWLGGVPRRFVFSRTPVERHRIVDVARWAAEGKLTMPIDSVHSSDRAGVLAAYERGMSGRAKGKILINMRAA